MLEEVLKRALRVVFGGGTNISAANPLQVWDPKVGSLISYTGVTTADGAPLGASLTDTLLAAQPDFNGNLVIITSGVCAGQARDINGVTTGGTVTPSIHFGSPTGAGVQIVAGTTFVIVGITTTPAEVAAIEAKLDHAAHGLAALKALIDLVEGKLDVLDPLIDDILVDTGTTLPGILTAIAGYIDTEVVDIKTQTDKIGNATIGLANLKALIDTLTGYVDIESATSLADKLTLARAGLLDRLSIIAAGGANELTGTRAGYLDNINNAQLLNISAAILGRIDATISSRLATASYTAERGTDNAALAADWTNALATALGNYSAALATALGLDAAPTAVGKLQIKATTFDLAQIGGTIGNLFTATTQDVVVEKLVTRMSGGTLVGSNLTSFKIQTNDTTPQVFISDTEAPVADLTDQAQKSWAPAGGVILLKAGKKIQITLTGGAATAAKVADVVAECRAVVAGGYLA